MPFAVSVFRAASGVSLLADVRWPQEVARCVAVTRACRSFRLIYVSQSLYLLQDPHPIYIGLISDNIKVLKLKRIFSYF